MKHKLSSWQKRAFVVIGSFSFFAIMADTYSKIPISWIEVLFTIITALVVIVYTQDTLKDVK